MNPHISLDQVEIKKFCKKHGIRKLSLFGSVLSSRFNDQSDIDILIEFNSHIKVGLMQMAQMELELSKIIGRKVDLRTPSELSRYFRQDVLDSAIPQYAQK